MNPTDKERIRSEARKEAMQDDDQEIYLEQRVRRWKRAAVLLGIALVVSVASIIPFLYGHLLHNQWQSVGKKLVLLSMALLCIFMYTAATAYNLYSYLKATKGVHKKFAPPGSHYRRGGK